MRLQRLLGHTARVENHAVPGFTSADAARYFARTPGGPWDVVVVHLGNNEAYQQMRKGAYRRWLTVPRPSRNGVRAERLVLSETEDDAPVATTPRQFRANLESIVRTARRRGTRVILLNPIANPCFPPGLMGANAGFHRIVGMHWRLAESMTGRGPAARALIDAIAVQERGDLATAAAGYRHLAGGDGPVAAIARNNLAVVLDRQGDHRGSLAILHRLVTGGGAAGAAASYNLARIHARAGCADEAHRYAASAVELDGHLYRVKDAYRRQVTIVSARAGVEAVDLAQLGPMDFVDYCHPGPRGHRAIATAIAAIAARLGTPAPEPAAGYFCVYPSPNAFFDPVATLFDYYSIDPDVDGREVKREAAALLSRTREASGVWHWPDPDSDLQARILNTFRHAVSHPIVTCPDDLRDALPRHGWEIGAFPEFYLYRLLAAGAEAAVHRDRILSRTPLEEMERPRRDDAYCRRVLDKVRTGLAREPALFTDSRAERIATIRYWYTREAFRYGTHSRPGMLYPAWKLETLTEGLRTCVNVAREQRDRDTEHAAADLLASLNRLRDVHEAHATGHEVSEYRLELAGVRRLFDRGK
ncbi:hypothetical protein [Nonomuraea endophytica]|uniref:hypothetical protein n=1 Tax=Nonomuraea endophytica TaxID=714136 RepID=UPI0037CAE45C